MLPSKRLLSRRDILAGAAGIAGAATLARPIATVLAAAAQPGTPVNFDVPSGACDCHTHVIGDARRFPFDASRSYTPESASVAEMRSLHRALHTERVVVVQPTFYGADNSCTLDAIKQIGPSARGVAVITDHASNAELDRLHRGGIRGIRIHIEVAGSSDAALVRQVFQSAAGRIAGRNWHVEVVVSRLSDIEAIREEVMASAVPVSFDLFGGDQASLGIGKPGFEALIGFLRGGKAYVNVSGPYRNPDVARIVKTLIAANPQRITWGTNWPHVARIPGRKISEITPLDQVDDGQALNQLPTRSSGAEHLKLILVENPARLYGF